MAQEHQIKQNLRSSTWGQCGDEGTWAARQRPVCGCWVGARGKSLSAGARPGGRFDLQLLAFAQHVDADGLAELGGLEHVYQILDPTDRVLADPDQQVATPARSAAPSGCTSESSIPFWPIAPARRARIRLQDNSGFSCYHRHLRKPSASGK